MKILSTLLIIGTAVATTSAVSYAKDRDTGRGTGPVVYVKSQNLFYDSIVVADPIPQKGRFQQLIPGENGLETEYGPGEVGHLGGRWWIDMNDNQIQDEGDKFFLCPLLGPGREAP